MRTVAIATTKVTTVTAMMATATMATAAAAAAAAAPTCRATVAVDLVLVRPAVKRKKQEAPNQAGRQARKHVADTYIL